MLFCLTVYFIFHRCEAQGYSWQRPCFFPSDFRTADLCVSICLYVSLHSIFFCHVYLPVCVPGCVSKCVLAVCFVCCSCCDRWSAAHAQINRPTLMKSGFCLLSISLSLSVPVSLCVFPLPPPLSPSVLHRLASKLSAHSENCAELQPSP